MYISPSDVLRLDKNIVTKNVRKENTGPDLMPLNEDIIGTNHCRTLNRVHSILNDRQEDQIFSQNHTIIILHAYMEVGT